MDNSIYIPLSKNQEDLLKKYEIKTFDGLLMEVQELHKRHLKLNERLAYIKSTLEK